MESVDPDARLMQRLQAGDQNAFDALVDRHHGTVFGLALRFLGHRSDAEDATQEIFMRVFRARSRYEPTARFTTWLSRVATNYCLNAAQANRLRRGTSAPESDPEVALMVSSDPGPESMIERAEVAGIVRDAVDALPDSQRMAIVLNKYQGLSYVEIGDAMGLSAKAVKSLLMRARVKLREALLRCQLPGVEDSREAGR